LYAKPTRGFEARTGKGVAAGHFNIADLVLLKAVFAPAEEANVPVLVCASEGERDFLGARQIAVLVRSLREEFDLPIFLTGEYTFVTPERQNELTHRIQEKLASSKSQGVSDPEPPTPETPSALANRPPATTFVQ